MTMIDVDTSPLQAAREWRGIGLVHAALTSGLPVTQAEALEQGDVSQFSSVDEMIASAVVYGASLGIGRDEATALLDRTISGPSMQVQVDLPDAVDAPAVGGFSDAVRERSARMSQHEEQVFVPMAVEPEEPSLDEPVAPAALEVTMPDVPGGPTPEQAVAASGEIHLDDLFGPEAPWEERGQTGELEQWVAESDDFDDDSFAPAVRSKPANATVARLGAVSHAGLERVVGTARADRAAEWTTEALARAASTARSGREKLRRSEHATLIVAIGAGALLIATMVAIGGALGGSEEPAKAKVPAGTGPLVTSTATDTTAATPAAGTPAKAATPAAMLPPAKLRLNVFNAGAKKGYAKEVADKLKGQGYGIGQVENSKGDYRSATVIHPKGMDREARLIAKRTGITTLEVAPGSSKDITVVVV
jgi:hypothetical protein